MTICGGLVLASSALADAPPGDAAQLQQLNRANESALWYQQQAPEQTPGVRQLSIPMHLDRRQRVEQQLLQERQRQQLLILNHRARVGTSPAVPYALQGIHLQRQFQLQQQNQLDRFRLQR